MLIIQRHRSQRTGDALHTLLRESHPTRLSQLVAANNESPALVLRVNTLRTTRDDMLRRLAEQGVAAAAGLGFAIASGRAIRRDVEEGRLVAIPLQPRLHTPLEVILPRDKFRSRLINAFADHVCEEFARIATEQD